jgi:hypothetical protein
VATDPDDERLNAIDRILREHAEVERTMDEQAAAVLARQRAFVEAFVDRCRDELCPEMEIIVARLRQDGGDGLVAFEPHGGRAGPEPRLTLWMSIEGEITGTPRQDRHPYLQFDAVVDHQQVRVSEGDMWHGGGTHHSGPVAMWELERLTARAVIDEVVAILARAAVEPGWADPS